MLRLQRGGIVEQVFVLNGWARRESFGLELAHSREKEKAYVSLV
jgi:hypothetical protein